MTKCRKNGAGCSCDDYDSGNCTFPLKVARARQVASISSDSFGQECLKWINFISPSNQQIVRGEVNDWPQLDALGRWRLVAIHLIAQLLLRVVITYWRVFWDLFSRDSTKEREKPNPKGLLSWFICRLTGWRSVLWCWCLPAWAQYGLQVARVLPEWCGVYSVNVFTALRAHTHTYNHIHINI